MSDQIETWHVPPNAPVVLADADGALIASAAVKGVPLTEQMARARKLAAAPAMLAALQAARPGIAREVDAWLECSAARGPDGKPDRETLDPDDAEGLGRLESLLAQIDAAIAQAAP